MRSRRLSMVRVAMIPGMAHAKRREHRDERAAREPAPAQQAVHQERRAGHVAAVLEDREEAEQDQDLRQEDEDAAHAADDAVHDEALERAAAQQRSPRIHAWQRAEDAARRGSP